jgi:hypothetical protein
MKIGPIGCPETSVLNQSTLRNNAEDGRIQANRRESLRSRFVKLCVRKMVAAEKYET